MRVRAGPGGGLDFGRGPGRGVWLCKSDANSCASKAVRSGAIERGLRAHLGVEALAQLLVDVRAQTQRGAPPTTR